MSKIQAYTHFSNNTVSKKPTISVFHFNPRLKKPEEKIKSMKVFGFSSLHDLEVMVCASFLFVASQGQLWAACNIHFFYMKSGSALIKRCCCHGNGWRAIMGRRWCPAAFGLEGFHWPLRSFPQCFAAGAFITPQRHPSQLLLFLLFFFFECDPMKVFFLGDEVTEGGGRAWRSQKQKASRMGCQEEHWPCSIWARQKSNMKKSKT